MLSWRYETYASWLNKRTIKPKTWGAIIEQILSALVALRNHIPSEFARKPRKQAEIVRWKATEFRQCLLYTGHLELRHSLHENMYKHFLLFSVSMHILLNNRLVELYSDYARELMDLFVDHFGQMYGVTSLVFNVHGLTHLADDAKLYGSLDNFFSYSFEHFLKDFFTNLLL